MSSRRRRCSARAATWSRITCRAYGVASTLVDGTDLEQWEKRGAAQHQGVLPGKPDQPGAGSARHRRDCQDRARGGRHAHRRQRVLDAALSAPAAAGRGLRGLFRHQAHRRPGPLPRRRDPGVGEIHPGQRAQFDPADRALDLARSTPGCCSRGWRRSRARAPPDRHRGDRRGRRSPSIRRSRGSSIRGGPIIRRRRSRGGR